MDLAPAYAGAPGGGAVIFNNSAGPNNLQLTVQLKGVKADFTYAVFLYVDCLNASCSWYGGAPVGEFTTNGVGNGTFHQGAPLRSGGRDRTRPGVRGPLPWTAWPPPELP